MDLVRTFFLDTQSTTKYLSINIALNVVTAGHTQTAYSLRLTPRSNLGSPIDQNTHGTGEDRENLCRSRTSHRKTFNPTQELLTWECEGSHY